MAIVEEAVSRETSFSERRKSVWQQATLRNATTTLLLFLQRIRIEHEFDTSANHVIIRMAFHDDPTIPFISGVPLPSRSKNGQSEVAITNWEKTNSLPSPPLTDVSNRNVLFGRMAECHRCYDISHKGEFNKITAVCGLF